MGISQSPEKMVAGPHNPYSVCIQYSDSLDNRVGVRTIHICFILDVLRASTSGYEDDVSHHNEIIIELFIILNHIIE